MRISKLDVRRAIKRMSEFVNDLQELEVLKKSLKALKAKAKQRKEIFQRIICYENKLREKWGCPVDAIVMSDEAARGKKSIPSVRPVTSIDRSPMKKLTVKRNNEIVKTHIEGECLYLTVDLSQTQQKLVKDFRTVLKQYQDTLINQNQGKQERQGETTEDIWDIYDLHMKEGVPLLEIARRLSGKDYLSGGKTPAYSAELWPPYKRVERAYKKAEQIIKTVSLHYPSRSNNSVDV